MRSLEKVEELNKTLEAKKTPENLKSCASENLAQPKNCQGVREGVMESHCLRI